MDFKISLILLVVSTATLWGQSGEKKADQKEESRYVPENFSGVVYKYVDFSNSTIIGQNTEANMQRIWGNDKLGSSQDSNPNDKIVIVDNDTVWSCHLPGTSSANQGVQYKGPMLLNGADTSDDTLTYVCFTYFIRLDDRFDWSNGGKQPGLAGSNRSGCETPNPPSGGLFAPSCGKDPSETYGYDAGFSARGARQSMEAGGENELGIYLYHHDLDWKSCEKNTYGYNMNMDSRSDTAYKTGQWYRMTERIVLNSVPSGGNGSANGILELYKDDILVAKKTDVVYRNFSDIYVNLYYLSTLSQFDSSRISESYIWYDDFILWADEDRSEHEIGYKLEIPELAIDHRKTVKPDEEPPTVPANLQISGTSQNSITVSWEPSTDNVGVANYRVFVDNELDIVQASATYTKTGLPPGSKHEFSISAVDDAGNESQRSEIINGTSDYIDNEAPTAPASVNILRVTGNSLELIWEPSEDNIGVDHYEIMLNGVHSGISDSSYYQVFKLQAVTLYEITVRAFDEAGNISPFSDPISIRTDSDDNEAPSKPTGLKSVSLTSESIQLTWNPSTDNVSINKYLIHVNNDGMAESDSNEIVLEGLSAGLTYIISVSAMDEAGNESPESDTIHVSTLNDDFTLSPKLPEVDIVGFRTKINDPGTTAEMKSLGFAELDSYGIIVTQGEQPVEEGTPYFAQNDLTQVENEGRISEGLQLLYNFSEKEGSLIQDISGAGEAINLKINRPLNTTWLPGQGLKIIDNTMLIHDGTPTRLIESLSETNEITLEVWISQCETDQSGPARILTLSNGSEDQAVSLGHEGNEDFYNYGTRLNTSTTDLNGMPDLLTSTDFTSLSLHHVVYTRDSKGLEKMYVNGIELASGIREGDFSSWTGDYKLVLGNESNGDQAWLGVIYLAAIYNEALSQQDVIQNFDTGFGKIRYTTKLAELEPNTSYQISPFIRTNQGIVYGDKKSFKIVDQLISEEEDLHIEVFPNPTDGEFKLHVEYLNAPIQEAMVRIVDMSGRLIMLERLRFTDESVETDLDFNIASQVDKGIFSVILTVGGRSVARRLVVH